MSIKHYLQFKDFSREEYDHLFQRSIFIKQQFKTYQPYQPLKDRTLAMVFEKNSTRTRVSFEAGMYQMGGIAINLTTGDTQLGRGEPIDDVARVISRMVDVVMIRTFDHQIIERFAEYSRVPVINGLTDEHHPCQIMADVFTFIEHRGPIDGKVVAWIGDGNNVARSWLQAARVFGFKLHVSTPPGFELQAGDDGGEHLKVFADPMEAARGADLVTTDVWTSMGWEDETEDRKQKFADWQVDVEMMQIAASNAL